jgi:hypothetical protein
VKDFSFVNYDDPNYVLQNPFVKGGLSLENIYCAVTETHAANWHPMTWLSHMIDCDLYGLNPGGHHLTSIFLHIANVLLLFTILSKATGCLWRSRFVAALFALHPVHVESIAWISERKDVLSVFFWMLTVRIYISYAKKPALGSYLALTGTFMLGLMSKPMVVTLPFTLLLLGFWPLSRIDFSNYAQSKRSVLTVVREKIPLFFLTTLSSVITFTVQQQSGAVKTFAGYPFGIRIANAIVSYVSYLVTLFWPSDLAVFYVHQGMPPVGKIAIAILLLLAISLLALKNIVKYPYFIFGWLWYLGALIPVIGIIQVGGQSHADRYAYLPFIGIYIIIA